MLAALIVSSLKVPKLATTESISAPGSTGYSLLLWAKMACASGPERNSRNWMAASLLGAVFRMPAPLMLT
jgi:hypothetical protein